MTAVCIAGMHRSGTSMIARLLNLSGLYLGEDEHLLDPAPDNPEGYWENVELLKINEAILAQYKSGWDLPPNLEPGWETATDLSAIKDRAQKALSQFEHHPFWGWKDPRNSLMLPFWKQLIPDLKVILCLRNPLEVAISLERRGYSSRAFSFNLWETYNQQLLDSVSPDDYLITHYPAYFSDPRDELIRLLTFVGLPKDERTIQDALAVVAGSLRHNQSSIADLVAAGAPPEVVDLYIRLCRGAHAAIGPQPGEEVAPAASEDAPPTAPVVDIVIPIYGQAQLVRKCVDSVLCTTKQARLILVDDVSPDEETTQLLAAYAQLPNVTVSYNQQNLGFIGTTRRGAELGDAPFILFLNSDTECIQAGWLDKMIPSQSDIAIVGARLLFPPDMPGPQAGTIQHAGVARNARGQPYHPFMGWPAGAPEVNTPREVNAVTGGCLLIRREVWQQLGGWDAHFGRGVFEDVDLCWAARKAGYRIQYQPAAALYHRESASKQLDGSHLLHAHSAENLKKLLKKWLPVASDEHLFFGTEAIQRWVRARQQIERAGQLIRQYKYERAFNALQKAVEIAPELAETLAACAQFLAAKGDHRRSAEFWARTVKVSPISWDARLHLVDELLESSDYERAAAELAQIQAVHPHHAAVKQRQARLVHDWQRAQKVEPSFSPQAVETLQMLLDQSDLLAALETYRHKLTPDLLSLVRANAQAARLDGNQELAEGLEALQMYVAEVLVTSSLSSSPAGC